MKLIKVLGDNVIIKGTTKKSVIIVDNKNTENKKLESLTVLAVGGDVKSVKVGDNVRIPRNILFQTERIVNPFQIELDKEHGKDNEFFINVKEDEIIGHYE
jgi:hypothetical protein